MLLILASNPRTHILSLVRRLSTVDVLLPDKHIIFLQQINLLFVICLQIILSARLLVSLIIMQYPFIINYYYYIIISAILFNCYNNAISSYNKQLMIFHNKVMLLY